MSQFTSRRCQSQAPNINLDTFEKSFSNLKYLNLSSARGPEQISKKIKEMVQQANKMISRLLYNLKYLYETNGIRYQINYYENVIMRILVPHQLLSHFHIIDNYEIFWGNCEEKNNLIKCKYQKKYRKIKNNLSFQNQNTQKFDKLKVKSNQWYEKTTKKSKKSSKNQHINNLPNQPPNTQIGQYQSDSQLKYTNKQNQKVCGSRPILGPNVEKKLVLWVIEQLASKKGVKLRQIAKQAKQMASNIEGFKSSRGWVSRFFYRHPYLKQMIKQSKAGNFQMIKLMYFKIRDKLFDGTIQQSEPMREKMEKDQQQQQQIQSSDQETINQGSYGRLKMNKDSEQKKMQEQSYEDIYQSNVNIYPYCRKNYGDAYNDESENENKNQDKQEKSKLNQRTTKIS